MSVPTFSAVWGRGLIKICGVQRPVDVQAALEGGAHLVGLVFVPGSRRRLTWTQARELRACIGARALAVGVFMDQPEQELHDTARAVGLDVLQLHGNEPVGPALKAGWPLIRRTRPGDARTPPLQDGSVWLLDPGAGQGVAHDWRRQPVDARNALVAGGLTSGNVAEIIALTAARGVDVSSGVEGPQGEKDPVAIAHFCAEARRAFARLHQSVAAV